jgi:sulfoxide reductase heme-binding subunit YedZ
VALVTAALWYLGRGTGVMSLVLLTIVVVLGIATRSGRPLPGLPRFAVAALHRSVSLLAVTFVAVHVVTLLLDPSAQIDLLAVIVPFTTAAHPFWYGLGALALDMLAALIVSSLLRVHLDPRVWRGIHWLAYACWPVALAHGLGSGSDSGATWMAGTALACVLTIAAAGWWRVSSGFAETGAGSEPPRRGPATRTLVRTR